MAAALACALWAQPSQAQAPKPRPAAVTGTASQSPLPDVTSTAYLLAPTDQLQIIVQGHDELTQTVLILGDGTFHYPIAGTVRASGKTVDQLEASLARGISGIVKDPQVTVLVRESHTRKISVAGAVKTPGLYDYHPGMRLLELLAASGGPLAAPRADPGHGDHRPGHKKHPDRPAAPADRRRHGAEPRARARRPAAAVPPRPGDLHDPGDRAGGKAGPVPGPDRRHDRCPPC